MQSGGGLRVGSRTVTWHEVATAKRAVVKQPGPRVESGVVLRHERSSVHSVDSAWPSLAQPAERLGVDIVCFASLGRLGMSKLLLGSLRRS